MPWQDCDLAGRKSRAHVRHLTGAEPGQVVMHRCDEPRCANPAHLVVGTQSENLADAWRKGRLRGSVGRGVDHQNAKLTDDDVHRIRELATAGLTQREIARQFGIGQPAVSRVVRGLRWLHVEGDRRAVAC